MLRTALQSLKISKQSGILRDENQYLCLVKDILREGEVVKGRNGETKAIFGAAMHFDLTDDKIPILTTKKVAWKTCLKELLWFIKGSTDNVELQKQNVKIWNGNATREFLDSRGLNNLEENDLGPVYGHQWRFFNAEYQTKNHVYKGKGVDQLQNIINDLKNPEKRSSRRMIMSAWNPCQIDEMALPPCHVMCQFNVIEDKLSCSMYQRSGDVGLGVPFNIASYSFLTHLLAHHCDLKPYEFVYYLGNAHIYDDHYEQLEWQTKLEPFFGPTLKIKGDKKKDIEDYKVEDFEIKNYKSHPSIKMNMRA